MNMKLIGICLIAILGTVFVTYGAYTYVNVNPEEGTIGEIEVSIWLDDVEIGNSTIDWGVMYPNNTYTYNYTVVNNIDTSILVYRESINLPSGWMETWAANGTILALDESASGWLNLTIPLSAVNGSYSWEGHTKAEYT